MAQIVTSLNGGDSSLAGVDVDLSKESSANRTRMTE
jgi:hypothetical protein